MSLMLSPHPSLVPLEMAAGGLVTVTNTYENKTKEKLSSISSNIIAVPPTLEGLASGIGSAAERVFDYDARIAGTDVHWPASWDEAFTPEFMQKLKLFMQQT